MPSHAIDTVTRFTKTLRATTTTTTLITITTALNILNQLVFVLRLFLYSDCYRFSEVICKLVFTRLFVRQFSNLEGNVLRITYAQVKYPGIFRDMLNHKIVSAEYPHTPSGRSIFLMSNLFRGIYLGVFQRSGHSVCLASAWLEASRTQWLCVFSCWVKLRFRGELIFPT